MKQQANKGAPRNLAHDMPHDMYEAPTSLPDTNPPPPTAAGLDAIDGLGEAVQL